MIIKHPDKHLTDQEFYTLIKFFDLFVEGKQIDDKESYHITYFGMGDVELGAIFNSIGASAEVLDLKVNLSGSKSLDEELVKAETELAKKSAKEKRELLKILDKIKSSKSISFGEIAQISWIWYDIYNKIQLAPSECKVTQEKKLILKKAMNDYLHKLINDKLTIGRKNFYKFEALKRILIKTIEKNNMINLYGRNFVIQEKIDDKCNIVRLPDFCLIQTVYALQQLDYLKVVDVWETEKYPKNTFDEEKYDYGKEPQKFINVNVVVNETLIEEINNQYKRNNPSTVLEKFDSNRGILHFSGQEIEISKNGKETDAVLLLKTLLKENTTAWKHNDEILSDWGYTDEDQETLPKNKVYFAGQRVNNAVALKTKIDDFLECNTSKARINPKYRKLTDS